MTSISNPPLEETTIGTEAEAKIPPGHDFWDHTLSLDENVPLFPVSNFKVIDFRPKIMNKYLPLLSFRLPVQPPDQTSLPNLILLSQQNW